MTTTMKSILAALAIVSALSLAACDQKQEGSTSGTTGSTTEQSGSTGSTTGTTDQGTTTAPATGQSGTTTQ